MIVGSFLPQNFDAIYGAAVGGGVAIIVSLFSDRHALKRLKLELSHQASQRELERQLGLKREVYIPLLEAASTALSFYGQIANAPIELIKQPESLTALGRHIAKLNIVASKEVMEAVQTANKQLTIGVIKLFKERIAIEAISSQLLSVESEIKFYESRSNSFNQRFEKHIDAGTGTGELRDVLIQLSNKDRETVQKLFEKKNALLLEKSALEVSLARLAAKDLQAFVPQNKVVLLVIRQDLGLPIDEKWLTEEFGSQTKEVFSALDDFHRDLDGLIAKAKGQAHQEAPKK